MLGFLRVLRGKLRQVLVSGEKCLHGSLQLPGVREKNLDLDLLEVLLFLVQKAILECILQPVRQLILDVRLQGQCLRLFGVRVLLLL